MTPLSRKTIQHFTHSHSLREVSADSEILCGGCKTLEDVRHAMHPYHPLRLQRSVPGKCMVCNDTCKSWHYRCGLCSFDLHLECVLSPCKGAMPTTSTARSLKTPMPPPSPVFSHCYGYGYGANPFPPPPNSAYAYGVPVAPPYFGPYDHDGYGILSSSFQTNFHCQHGNSSQGQGGAGKVRKKMYAIAGKLALGVLSNVVFGTLSL
ncbi:Pyrroline-5-carboxylate synthetase isoform 1 [Hibiscus syriacus]|uniref:Pyrroline-5-carboxylate synthetase isoform 1 n=1 Tax=Hibiscus syriacus TaxID=106335 RepID=A0A6A2XL60_HIBSY|nr:Pyrroline-5-carboxylate synthetase isoform 1 [Hibiscus syriacus]